MNEQDGRFEYDCQTDGCEGTMRGGFGDDVTCPVCGTVWETDWDYSGTDTAVAWIVRPVPR